MKHCYGNSKSLLFRKDQQLDLISCFPTVDSGNRTVFKRTLNPTCSDRKLEPRLFLFEKRPTDKPYWEISTTNLIRILTSYYINLACTNVQPWGPPLNHPTYCACSHRGLSDFVSGFRCWGGGDIGWACRRKVVIRGLYRGAVWLK